MKDLATKRAEIACMPMVKAELLAYISSPKKPDYRLPQKKPELKK